MSVSEHRWHLGPDLIVFVLAIALCVSTIIFAIALLYEVVDHASISEVPPNSSNVLIAIFSGIIGIIGSYVGYNQADRNNQAPLLPPNTVAGAA